MNFGKLFESKRQRNNEAMVLRSSSESRFGNKPHPQSCGHSATNTVPQQSSSTQQQGGDCSRARRRPFVRLVREVSVGIVLLLLVSGVVMALQMKAWLDRQRLDEEDEITMILLRSRKNHGTNMAEPVLSTLPSQQSAQPPLESTGTKATPVLLGGSTTASHTETVSSRRKTAQSTTTTTTQPLQTQTSTDSSSSSTRRNPATRRSSTNSTSTTGSTNQRYQLEQWAKQDRKRHRQSAKYRLFGSNQKGGGDETNVDFAHGKQVSERYHHQQQPTKKTNPTVVPDYFTDYDEYTRLLWETTTPDPTRPMLAFGPLEFTFGYINQVMTFAGFVLYAYDHNFRQILLPSLHWKDLFGSNRGRPHATLFDVVRWNTLYSPSSGNPLTNHTTHGPAWLPRLVRRPESGMTDLHPYRMEWLGNVSQALHRATAPYGVGYHPNRFMNLYRHDLKQYVYTNATTNSNSSTATNKTTGNQRRPPPLARRGRHPVDLAMLQHGALVPHPSLMRVVHETVQWLQTPSSQQTPSTGRRTEKEDTDNPPNTNDSNRHEGGYLCLHARIEPDMKEHGYCVDQKVLSLSDILRSIYREFPPHQPPPGIHRVLLVLNRPLLEQHVATTSKTKSSIAAQNLQLLNQLRREGMWNGTIPVHEAGTSLLLSTHDSYAKNASSSSSSPLSSSLSSSLAYFRTEARGIASSMIDYELALQAQMFVGTPVSSFSMQAMATRYHRHRHRHGQEQHHSQSVPSSSSSSWSSGDHDETSVPVQNYLYLPHGLKRLPPDQEPPQFVC